MKTRNLFPHRVRAFTIVELLASMALIAVIMAMLLQVTGMTQKLWLDGRSKSAQFRESRTAFEAMTRQLSQATLNNYWDYEWNTSTPPVPTAYIRQSDLHFVVGSSATLLNAGTPTPSHCIFFQAPAGMVQDPQKEGMDALVNSLGYYVCYGSDLPIRPDFLSDGLRVPARMRYRLMEYRQPSENFPVFGWNLRSSTSKKASDYYQWFSGFPDRKLLTDVASPIAENIVALVISPRMPLPKINGKDDPKEYRDLAPNYAYDSREFQWGAATSQRVKLTKNQLPPTLMVTMVAIDEVAGDKLGKQFPAGADPKLLDDKWFIDVDKHAEDLKALEKKLIDQRINYRFFTTAVSMRNSKWSQSQ